jgi:zinc protease
MLVTPEAGHGPAGKPSLDPATRLEQEFDAIMQTGIVAADESATPVMIVVAGDVVEDHVLALLEQAFGKLAFKTASVARSANRVPADVVVTIGKPIAQAQLGYIVPAPGPGARLSDAFRMLLYILSHDYGGRLGDKAISDRGLVYYIDSRYRSDGTNAWITLSTGVDPAKMESLKALLAAELERLHSDPPTEAEILEARRHMIGRLQSAAQSNAELCAQLTRQWLWYGEIVTVEALQRRLDNVSRQDVLDIVPDFADGATIVVSE